MLLHNAGAKVLLSVERKDGTTGLRNSFYEASPSFRLGRSCIYNVISKGMNEAFLISLAFLNLVRPVYVSLDKHTRRFCQLLRYR